MCTSTRHTARQDCSSRRTCWKSDGETFSESERVRATYGIVCVVCLQVTDADEGVNAEIEFVEIKEGLQNEELLFSIGQDGTLTTSRYIY